MGGNVKKMGSHSKVIRYESNQSECILYPKYESEDKYKANWFWIPLVYSRPQAYRRTCVFLYSYIEIFVFCYFLVVAY